MSFLGTTITLLQNCGHVQRCNWKLGCCPLTNTASTACLKAKSRRLLLTNIITPHKLSTIPHAACLGPHTKPPIVYESSVFGKEQQNQRVGLVDKLLPLGRHVTWLNTGSREGVLPRPLGPPARRRQSGRHIGPGTTNMLYNWYWHMQNSTYERTNGEIPYQTFPHWNFHQYAMAIKECKNKKKCNENKLCSSKTEYWFQSN